jgi:ABC-2 type transport system ATP-binding protein
MSSTSLDNVLTGADATAPPPDRPPAIKVDDLHKSFHIPTQRVDSLKERVVHPFAARDYRELHALDGISFEVKQGEFFGIVGRNGSGKSTLLKLLASIYRADSGRIRIAGRLAPFIELGVGFNPELTARENVLLNGVMMGLTPNDVREREDAVIDFAELHDFADLKLKNFSSGMLVRLAFSVMLQADADILLIDEVLAVGDAAFQQKCSDAFHDMKAAGKTIILVTHDMGAIENYCDRAMLLAEGDVKFVGPPPDIAREYLKLNFEGSTQAEAGTEFQGTGARLLAAAIVDAEDEEVTTVEIRKPLRVRAQMELLQPCHAVQVGWILVNDDELGILHFGELLTEEMFGGEIPLNRPITVTATVENRLAAGRYFLHSGISGYGGISVSVPKALSFVVFGPEGTSGLISPDVEYDVHLEEER